MLADGDLSTPFRSFTMHWDSPLGTRVILEGDVDPPRLRVRSVPQKEEAELLAMLLLDGAAAREPSDELEAARDALYR